MRSDQQLVWWSWADIVEHADRLGIPNFQRGAVWGMGNRTALLESMYEQSPCGSFVLWQPNDHGDPRRHGVPIQTFGQAVDPMWLVDGQQRTRAMLDTYLQLLDTPSIGEWSLVREEDLTTLRTAAPTALHDALVDAVEGQDEDGDDAGLRFWGVVLPAMRQFDEGDGGYFANKSESRGVRRGSVFRRHSPSARVQRDSRGREKRVPPHVLGMVPLAALVSPVGVLHDPAQRRLATQALDSLRGDAPDFESLDRLLPWGPLFVTGHVYETDGEDTTVPMRWADVLDHDVEFMLGRLRGLFADEWLPVFEQFRDMLAQGRFAVGWLPKSDMSAAIDAYVRINRAGIRVRQEEQALALLSRAYPHLLDELAEFIRLRDGYVSAEDGRSLLVHESDRQMGFAVWMRTVTRYAALALLGTIAAHWLGSSAIDKDTFSYRLGRVGESETPAGKKTWARSDYNDPSELVRECSAHATRVLALVDSVLSRELLLDHRMARPATWALTPLVDLLYRVPTSAIEELEDEAGFRGAIARLLHWTMLAPYLDQTDVRRLIDDAHALPGGYVEEPISRWSSLDDDWRGELREAMGRYQTTLLDLWRRKVLDGDEKPTPPVTREMRSQALTDLAVRAFGFDVSEARSLQHPAVGWLYAIERRGGAREFSWQSQYEGYRDGDGRTGIPEGVEPYQDEERLRRPKDDSRLLYPEKQHIVPFDHARRIVGKRGTRATASPANAIGNLTWLSQRQNGLDGFSNRWTVMDVQRDHANLLARGMLSRSSADENAPTALSLYEVVRDAVWAGTGADAEQSFSAFCETRGEWMISQMREWLEEPPADGAAQWLEGGAP